MPSSTTRQIREMINNFLLDADETILDFVRSSRESFFIAMQQLGLLLGENEFLQFKAINDGLWQEYEQGTVTKPQLMKERFARLFEALGVNADMGFYLGTPEACPPVTIFWSEFHHAACNRG